MKNAQKLNTLLLTATALFIANISKADEGHNEIKAPNGGRIVESVEPHFEIYVNDDRYVSITFLDDEGNTLPPESQVISLIGGDRANPTRLTFAEENNQLVSSGTLPSDNGIPIILSIQESPSSRIIREKFNLNMATCPECVLAEYACSCDHEEGHHD